MKTLLTAEALSTGGRSGTVRSPDGLLDLTLGNPLDHGAERRGPGPELLFAAAYSACYQSALVYCAAQAGSPANDATVRVLVRLVEDDVGGSHLGVELHARLPGLAPDLGRRLMAEAHATCPYSRALRGGVTVGLTLD